MENKTWLTILVILGMTICFGHTVSTVMIGIDLLGAGFNLAFIVSTQWLLLATISLFHLKILRPLHRFVKKYVTYIEYYMIVNLIIQIYLLIYQQTLAKTDLKLLFEITGLINTYLLFYLLVNSRPKK